MHRSNQVTHISGDPTRPSSPSAASHDVETAEAAEPGDGAPAAQTDSAAPGQTATVTPIDLVTTPTNLRRYIARRLSHDHLALAGGVVVILAILTAIFAPLITHLSGTNPYSYNLNLLDGSGLPRGPFGGASFDHPFGLEPQTGRDLFAIVVQGARTSLLIGLGAASLAITIATLMGVTAGYFGGWWDTLVSRIIDVTLGFPQLVFLIAISAIVPASIPKVPVMVIVIGALGWPSTARVLRARTLSLRQRTFVQATRAMGAPNTHILIQQILPNLAATIIVFTTISIPGMIGAEAVLSFLGVGVPPPTPSWGRAIGSAVSWISIDPWYLAFPGLALFLVTLAFNLLGDGLRDALDPKTGEKR